MYLPWFQSTRNTLCHWGTVGVSLKLWHMAQTLCHSTRHLPSLLHSVPRHRQGENPHSTPWQPLFCKTFTFETQQGRSTCIVNHLGTLWCSHSVNINYSRHRGSIDIDSCQTLTMTNIDQNRHGLDSNFMEEIPSTLPFPTFFPNSMETPPLAHLHGDSWSPAVEPWQPNPTLRTCYDSCQHMQG